MVHRVEGFPKVSTKKPSGGSGGHWRFDHLASWANGRTFCDGLIWHGTALVAAVRAAQLAHPMLSENYTPLHALAGGILIGLGTLLASAATGKTVGISGAFSKVLRRKEGEVVRWVVFLAGLVAGAILVGIVFPSATIYRPQHSLMTLAVAGLLVGFGTRISGGCTSGHGVSGIGLGSKSGIVATLVFMAAGMATVYVINHLLGGQG